MFLRERLALSFGDAYHLLQVSFVGLDLVLRGQWGRAMRSVLKSAVVAAALASMAGQALAEQEVVEISDMSGKVLVNMGNGYISVPNQTLLREGDAVMVGDDGEAIIVYLDTKCRVKLPARTVTTISLPSPCKAAVPIPQASSGASFASQPLVWIAVGGLAFAGGIAYLVTDHENEEGNPSAISGP